MDVSEVPPWPVYGSVVRDEVADLVADGRVYDYAGQAPVTVLEQEFAHIHEGRHVVSFNSGTSALFAALSAFGVGEGDEVIVPNLTFLASASPALWLGAKAVLVDSSEDDPSVDPAAIERAITRSTKVVVVTHLFGNPVDVEAIATICTTRGVRLLEDCSHAHASSVGSTHVGLFGDAAIYSLGAGKLVSGGHGGLLVTADPVIRDLALLVGHFKPRTRADVLTDALRPYAEFALGGNLRLSPIAALLALSHLRSIEQISRDRCANVAVLDEHLDELLLPVRSPEPRSNLSHFDIVYLLPQGRPPHDRAAILERLVSAGVPATAPSTRPLNRVLRTMPAPTAAADNVLLRRLSALVATAPSDNVVPHSVSLHDRMVSFPANRLYRANTSVAHSVGKLAATVVRGVLGGPR